MHIYLKQGGSVSSTMPEGGEELGWNKIILPADAQEFLTVLSDDVIVVKFHNRTDGLLVVFPYSAKGKARVLRLHNFSGDNKRLSILHEVFAKLLDFDDGRLTNRSRNRAITIVRELLPDVVRNYIGNKEDEVTFYLHKDQLSLYKKKTLKTKLTHYILFSRNIKDSLL